MKHVPLFYYASTWVLVDDDPMILESLSKFLGKNNNVRTFDSSKTCLDFLKTYQPFLSQQIFLQSKDQDELYGALKHAPVDFDVTCLAKLADLPSRHDEISVMVVDYSMPEINGFSLAQASSQLPMYKILLTGEAQLDQAVGGFNQKLIHRFIQKGNQATADELDKYLKELTLQYFQTQTLHLLTHLEADGPLPLSDPIFIDFFNSYCEEHHIREYYLIDKHGSFLCINNHGKRSCLLVHTHASLDDWIDLYEEDFVDPSSAEMREIKWREKIPFCGIGRSEGDFDPSKLADDLYTPKILEGRQRYFWARVEAL